MAERDHSWHLRRAQRLLVTFGFEMPGTELSMFVVRLLHGLDAGLGDASNVNAAALQVSDWPLGLLASEPGLARIDLPVPVRTAEDAAERTLRVFAGQVLDRQRRDPVVPKPAPSPEQMQAMRAEMRAQRGRTEPDVEARVAVERARLASPRWIERASAASYLGRFAVTEARQAIETLLDDPYPEVADAAASALRALPRSTDDRLGPAPAAPELPDFGEAYDPMDADDAMGFVERHFVPLRMDLQTFKREYRNPADGSLWIVDYPGADRPSGGRPRVRRIGP